MPPYTPRPFVQRGFEPNLRFGDLIRSQGRTRAEAELRSGDIAAQMWGNLGQTIAGTVSNYAREREEAPMRQMQRENVEMEHAARKADARDTSTAKQIQGNALTQGEDGVWTYDRHYLTQAFQEAGIADRLPSVLEGLDAFDNSARAVQKAKQEGLAGLAFGVTQLGNTPQAFNQAIELALKNGFLTRADVGPLIQKVGDDPAKIGELVMAIASSSPTFAEKLAPKQDDFTLSPGQQRFGPDGQPIASVPAAPSSGFNLSPGQTRFGPDGKPVASLPAAPSASDDKPSVWVSKDGDMRFVTPQQAGELSLQGWKSGTTREQGRPVTSGDANRIADYDTALDDLAVLTTTIPEGSTGTRAKIGASLPNWITEWTGRGATAKSKQAVIDRVKQVIGKALEGGVLRKEDEYKYEKILPIISDVDSVVEAKLKGLDSAIRQRRSTLIDALADAGYDTSKYVARTDAAPSDDDGWIDAGNGIRWREKP